MFWMHNDFMSGVTNDQRMELERALLDCGFVIIIHQRMLRETPN